MALSLWLVRSQGTVRGAPWMKAMAAHHPVAILTGERAHLPNPHVRRLAHGIVETQRKEAAEMLAPIQKPQG